MHGAVRDEIWASPMRAVYKIVLLALLDYGKSAYPCQRKLAAKCGLSRRALQNAVDGLRADGWLETSTRGKALRYVVKRTTCASRSARGAPEKRTRCAGEAHEVRRDPNPILNPIPNPPAAVAASGGWEVDGWVWDRILQRDPRADATRQANVCQRVLAQHAVPEQDQREAWDVLTTNWARTGVDAYAKLASLTEDMKGVHNASKVLMHRIRGVA